MLHIIATILAIIAPGTQCDIVADTWQPEYRGTITTRGCTDTELGA